MPRHPFAPPRGTLTYVTIDSRALRGAMLGDPHERTVAVYQSPGAEAGDCPLLVALAGFTGSGLKLLAWRAFAETLPQRIDRLVASGRMGPVVVAMPDAFTSLGGNQYVDSPVLGRWEAFIHEEMLPAIEARFPIAAGARHRAIFGKSSGGYGALVQAMRHPGQWAAVACHSGDMGFDVVYRRDLHLALDALAPFGGDPAAFVRAIQRGQHVDGAQMHALMVLAMAASYAPEPDAPLGIRLPLDPWTGELDNARWQRWLEWDPVHMIAEPRHQEALRGLAALWLDCGHRDQYFIHYGMRQFVRCLERYGIPHVYEEFDGTHSHVDHRLDRSLPHLYAAIRPV